MPLSFIDLQPETVWHLRQAGECDRLATEREKLGDTRGANFWRRIYQEKMGDAWKSRPLESKPSRLAGSS